MRARSAARWSVPSLSGTPHLRYAACIAAVALLTALLSPVRGQLGLLNVGLLYLLLVVLVAARWGLWPSVATSVLAILAINFFFVPPLHTLHITEGANVLALAVFLGVAALFSALLARARSGEAAERRRAAETAILYDLSRLIIVAPSTAAALTSVCARLRDAFEVESCAILMPGNEGLRAVAWSGPIEAAPQSAYERRAAEECYRAGETVSPGGRTGRLRPRIIGRPDRRETVTYIPLRISGATVGVLQVVGKIQARVFTEDELRLLEAFADEAALAVDRDRLVHEAARAEALQETDRLRSALLSAVSHDLRTPLTAILTSVSSLLQTEVQWDAETRQEFLTSIESQALRLNRLVSNLLDLSKIEGGGLHAETGWYDVRDLLEEVIESLAGPLARHHVALEVAPDVGEAPFAPVQIGQVMSNLLENAAKFAPPDTQITVRARRIGDEVEISVADEGPGVPGTERDEIFKKFYRGSASIRGVSGSGLGLAISKGLVEANGGRIGVTTAPGGGACFTVNLPAPHAPGRPVPAGMLSASEADEELP